MKIISKKMFIKPPITSIILALVSTLIAACDSSSGNRAGSQFISIGTGGVQGVYYAAGDAVCGFVNVKSAEHGIHCSAVSTGGSLYNLNKIRTGALDFGIAQSDLQYSLYNGGTEFVDKGAFKGLRVLFANHSEPFTVIARADAGIRKFTDLKNKKVNVGNPGSGTRATMQTLMAAFDITEDDFALVSELKSSEQAAALCDGRVDVIASIVGHPNTSITEMSNECDVLIVGVGGEPVDKIITDNPFYAMSTIPAGMYKGHKEDVKTIGAVALFVTSKEVTEERVYTVTKALFSNFVDYKKMHPAFALLSESTMITNGVAVPIHEGAMQYYRERGWK